jgi:hypothetical protein
VQYFLCLKIANNNMSDAQIFIVEQFNLGSRIDDLVSYILLYIMDDWIYAYEVSERCTS